MCCIHIWQNYVWLKISANSPKSRSVFFMSCFLGLNFTSCSLLYNHDLIHFTAYWLAIHQWQTLHLGQRLINDPWISMNRAQLKIPPKLYCTSFYNVLSLHCWFSLGCSEHLTGRDIVYFPFLLKVWVMRQNETKFPQPVNNVYTQVHINWQIQCLMDNTAKSIQVILMSVPLRL